MGSPQQLPVFRDVFAFADALPVDVRLRLSALLAVPGHSPAILPRQLASSPLPVVPEAQAEIRRAIEVGFTAPTIENLAPHPLADVVPALARCDPGALARSAPSQVRALLGKYAAGPGPIVEWTIRQISGWPGFGPMRVAQPIGAAVAAALDVVAEELPDPIGVTPTPDDLGPILLYDAVTGGQLRVLLENMRAVGRLRSLRPHLGYCPARRSSRIRA